VTSVTTAEKRKKGREREREREREKKKRTLRDIVSPEKREHQQTERQGEDSRETDWNISPDFVEHTRKSQCNRSGVLKLVLLLVLLVLLW